MNNKLISSISTLLLSCTPAAIQPRQLSPIEQQSRSLHHIDQYLTSICEKSIVSDKEIHCTLPKEPFYFRYSWDELKQTSCHGPRLYFDTIINAVNVPIQDTNDCIKISREFNTYLELANRK